MELSGLNIEGEEGIDPGDRVRCGVSGMKKAWRWRREQTGKEGQSEAEMPPPPGNSLSHACSPFVSGKMHLIPLIQSSKCNGSPCELIFMLHIHFPLVHQLVFIQMEINFIISLMLWPSRLLPYSSWLIFAKLPK